MGVWIETHQKKCVIGTNLVTPFVGVWIETLTFHHLWNEWYVTPFVGVWIETRLSRYSQKNVRSHPSWVCGLKHYDYVNEKGDVASHPSWVCGLKQLSDWIFVDELLSHPSWVCGLKLIHYNTSVSISRSHPSWVCGLKLIGAVIIVNAISHTLRGCVEWNRKQILFSEPTWKSHFYENVPLIVNKLQWQKIWFGTSLSGLSLVLYSNL